VSKNKQRGSDVQPLPNEEITNPGGEHKQQSDTADDHSDRPMKPAHPAEPQKDHSERAGGGDQDIDTAGMVPGNKATKNTEPTGF
jgi:hypothetical protein